MIKGTEQRTWVEVDKKAMARNVLRLKRFLEPHTRFMAVVKSNAYGHGMTAYARELSRLGVDFFGVDDVDEALELRKAGIKESILVLGYTLPARYAEAAAKNISITISSADSLAALVRSRARGKKRLKIHLKVDTGLHRQGMMPSDKARVMKILSDEMPHVEIEGLYSHFAALETPGYIDYSRTQAERLAQWQDLLLMHGYDPIVHASASAGVVWSRDDFRFDMVRAGIALYGLWPSEEIRNSTDPTALRPVLSWKTVVSEVKDIPSGSRIGYDLTETVSRASTIAVIPVGYWH
ncbi:MAG: alanine racemase, partial [Candidatus Paceibacterota bacterium]